MELVCPSLFTHWSGSLKRWPGSSGSTPSSHSIKQHSMMKSNRSFIPKRGGLTPTTLFFIYLLVYLLNCLFTYLSIRALHAANTAICTHKQYSRVVLTVLMSLQQLSWHGGARRGRPTSRRILEYGVIQCCTRHLNSFHEVHDNSLPNTRTNSQDRRFVSAAENQPVARRAPF